MKKEIAIKALEEMSAQFNLDDYFEKLILLEKIESGKIDAQNGNTVTHQQVQEEISKWSK